MCEKTCKTCSWYVAQMQLCYEQWLKTPPTFVCPSWTNDKGLNTHTETTKGFNCQHHKTLPEHLKLETPTITQRKPK